MAVSPSLANNTIALDISEFSPSVEGLVHSLDIYPGMLVYRTVTGTFLPNSTSGAIIPPIMALENGYSGGTINTKYDVLGIDGSQNVMARILREGDRVLTKVEDGPIGYGEPLTPSFTGWLRSPTTGDYIIAFIDEYDPLPTYPKWTAVKFGPVGALP